MKRLKMRIWQYAILVLVLLSGYLFGKFMNKKETLRQYELGLTKIERIEKALNYFYLHCRYFPREEHWKDVLQRKKPPLESCPQLQSEPYIDLDFLFEDQWGNPILYARTAKYRKRLRMTKPRPYIIGSAGPDRRIATADDVTNVSEEWVVEPAANEFCLKMKGCWDDIDQQCRSLKIPESLALCKRRPGVNPLPE